MKKLRNNKRLKVIEVHKKFKMEVPNMLRQNSSVSVYGGDDSLQKQL